MRKLLLICFLLSPLAGQAQHSETLHALLDQWDTNQRYMGEVLIISGNDPVVHRYLGYNDFEKNVPHDTASTFAIGSISKTFTAVMVLQAIDENKLGYNNTIEEFLPDLPNANTITIHHLLAHSSGLKNYTENRAVFRYAYSGAPLIDLIAPLHKMESNFIPGVKFQYSNSNYIILSHILELIYNKDYQSLLEEKITLPISLTNTYLSKVNSGEPESKPKGYIRNGQTFINIPAIHPLFASGAGGINSTASDINKFSKALFDEVLIPAERLKQMTATTEEETYGLGIYRSNILGKAAIGHNGAINGFHSDWLYFPEEDVTMVLLMNRDTYSFPRLVQEIVAAYFELPLSPADYKVEKSIVEEITGTYALSPQFKITIFEDEDVLYSQATFQGANALIEQGDLAFKVKGVDAIIRFDKEEGKISHLILEQGGQQTKGLKE